MSWAAWLGMFDILYIYIYILNIYILFIYLKRFSAQQAWLSHSFPALVPCLLRSRSFRSRWMHPMVLTHHQLRCGHLQIHWRVRGHRLFVRWLTNKLSEHGVAKLAYSQNFLGWPMDTWSERVKCSKNDIFFSLYTYNIYIYICTCGFLSAVRFSIPIFEKLKIILVFFDICSCTCSLSNEHVYIWLCAKLDADVSAWKLLASNPGCSRLSTSSDWD